MKHKNEREHCFLFEKKIVFRKIELAKALYTKKADFYLIYNMKYILVAKKKCYIF